MAPLIVKHAHAAAARNRSVADIQELAAASRSCEEQGVRWCERMHGEAQRCEASVRDLPAQRANATPTSQRLPTCAPRWWWGIARTHHRQRSLPAARAGV